MASNYPTEVVSQSGDELVIRVFIRPVATVVPNRTRTDPAVSTEGVHPFGPGDVSVSSQDVRVRLARGETLTPSRRQVYGQKGRGPRRTTQALMGEELGPAGMGPPEAPPVFPNGWVPRPREEITPDRPVYYGTECCTRWPRENEVAINCVCGHRIHEGCLTSLLRAYRHDGCPVCVDATTYQQRMGKPASMSSTYVSPFFPADASKGNDGMIPTNSSGEIRFRFHTEYEQNPWWRCDITNVCLVTSVYFMNRGWIDYNNEVYWTRTRNIRVTVSELEANIMYNGGDNECGFIPFTAQQFDNLVTCSQPMFGRFVQLQMIDTDYLNLYEVEVYGYTLNP